LNSTVGTTVQEIPFTYVAPTNFHPFCVKEDKKGLSLWLLIGRKIRRTQFFQNSWETGIVRGGPNMGRERRTPRQEKSHMPNVVKQTGKINRVKHAEGKMIKYIIRSSWQSGLKRSHETGYN